jgi:hypothetical protein
MLKFTMMRWPTIMDGLVIRWKLNDFEISASRNGVMVQGHTPAINDYVDLGDIADQLKIAYGAHKAIKLTGDYKEQEGAENAD